MIKKWELFHVGLRRPEWVGLSDGQTLEWTDESGLVLFVFLNNPSNKEMADMSSGQRFEIAFKDISGIGFFCFRFAMQAWSDCSFTPNIYNSTPKFESPKTGGGKTYALHIMLVDTSVGELKLMRSIGLGEEFAEHFRTWALQSLNRNIGRRLYDRVTTQVHIDYPDPETLAEQADIRWSYVHGEDEQTREVERENHFEIE